MESNIDINKLDECIKKIKYPIIFLFRLVTHLDELSDHNLSIILRLFLKHHVEIALGHNLKIIFMVDLDLNDYFQSISVINDFYKLMNKKISLVMVLKKFHSIWDNNNFFWKYSTQKQIDYLHYVNNQFLSIYDCSRGGIPYHIKLINLLKEPKCNKGEVLEDLKNRLIMLLKLFGSSLFQTLGIPIISISDFYNLSDDNLIKYVIFIYEKINELLNQTIKLFESYNLTCVQISSLINPVVINVNSSLIDSETDAEDINLLCGK